MDLNSIIIPKGVIIVVTAVSLGALFYFSGGYRIAKKITHDCLYDHTTCKYTINNLARFLSIFVTLYLITATHMDIELQPHFKIITHRPSTELVLVLLAFIIGQEAVKKIPSKNDKPTENIQ